MDDVWYTRLKEYVQKSLKANISLDNISQWALLVAEFTEDFATNNKIHLHLGSQEKHQLFLSWVDRLMKDILGKTLTPFEKQLISGSITLICEITKKGSRINNNGDHPSEIPPTEVSIGNTNTVQDIIEIVDEVHKTVKKASSLKALVGCPCTKKQSD